MSQSYIAATACLLTALACASPTRAAEEKKYDPAKWEKTIAKFEAADKQDPPAKGGVLFIGSSSIRMWKLDDSFPKLDAVNRGFGGSHMEDTLYYANRIVLPYQPRTIVVYAGDNDTAFGKPPEVILDHYQAFVKKVHAKLPKTRIVYIAIKPSLKRWNLWPTMSRANGLIRDHAAKDDRLLYADIAAPMLGKDGKPQPELFVKDGLHLSKAGYQAWSKVVGPMVGVGIE